jgi:hypothetical protein
MGINHRTKPSAEEGILHDNAVCVDWLGTGSLARRVIFVSEEVDPPVVRERSIQPVKSRRSKGEDSCLI